MALTHRPTLDGVGLNKKHDLPHYVHRATPPKSMWIGFRRRRLFLTVVAVLAVFFFVKNIPTDVVPVGRRYNSLYGSMAPGHVQAHAGQENFHDMSQSSPAGSAYDGSIQLPNLMASLRPQSAFGYNTNVLFALPSLSSTSSLVPIACQMARNNRSSVHVAILGAQDVGVKKILSINGIHEDDCPVIWHDARPDHPFESSQERLFLSIRAGFEHCCDVLRPQATFVDDTSMQNVYVEKSLRDATWSRGLALVELPGDVSQSLPWISSLDSRSLKQLNGVEIEIVIQAYTESAAPLLRLLRSIQGANYRGLFFPRLTIELPAQIDPFVLDFLEAFTWPPGSRPSESRLTLRHRISKKNQNVPEATMRTIESFFPRTADTSHVLLLSPDAELSPSYLHYIMLTLLEYKYSILNGGQSTAFFGISLDLPDKKLDDQKPFYEKAPHQTGPLIRLQAPSNNAALITGDRWIDFHKFLTQRLVHDPELLKKTDAAALVSEEHPQWLAEAQNYMIASNQYMLYPTFASNDEFKLVTLHQELNQSPEEYFKASYKYETPTHVNVDPVRNLVVPHKIKLPAYHDNSGSMLSSLPLQKLLVHDESNQVLTLPDLFSIPMFSHKGAATNWLKGLEDSVEFANKFSLKQGGCKSLKDRDKTAQGTANYFFCDAS